MNIFQNIDTFVRVAEAGSFAEAARQMNVSKSVVTNRVQQLEDLLGTYLFHRSTRHVSLSSVGELYLNDCAELISRSNELLDLMRDTTQASPAGNLRIHALPGIVLDRMPQLINRFMARYPGITFDIVVNDAIIDPVKEGFDCALQIFPAATNELTENPLFPLRRVFCASPQYLLEHPPIVEPEDLQSHSLGLYSRYPTKHTWTFGGDAEDIVLDLTPGLQSNSIHLLHQFAKDHGGVVCIPTITACEAIESGDLELVLSDYNLSYFWLSAVFPRTQRNVVKLRLFLDALEKEFSGVPVWDQKLAEYGLILD